MKQQTKPKSISSKSPRYYYFYGIKLTEKEAIALIKNEIKAAYSPKSRYQRIIKYMPKGKVLEYGCGWGFSARVIGDQTGNQVIGIDIDKTSIDIAKKFVGETEHVKFTYQKINQFKTNSFNSVVSACVIQNTFNPGNYLAECNRILKNGGRLLITVYNDINPVFITSHMLVSQKKVQKIFSKKHDFTVDPLMSWHFYHFCRFARSLGFKYVTHEFVDGMSLPRGYLHFPLFKKFYRSVLFVLEKDEYIKPPQFG